MPRSRNRTSRASAFLSGPRLDVGHRGKGPLPSLLSGPVVLQDGTELNQWEYKVYLVLTKIGVPFDPQAKLGPSKALGGALVDFLIYEPPIALEVQGPFHQQDVGEARDFWRRVERDAAGYPTVYVYQADIESPYLYRIILNIIANPISSSVTRSD